MVLVSIMLVVSWSGEGLLEVVNIELVVENGDIGDGGSLIGLFFIFFVMLEVFLVVDIWILLGWVWVKVESEGSGEVDFGGW